MAFRFQKRIKILPGVRLNISKSGISTTIGGRGASVNIGKRGVYGNAGIPGTGLSMRERLDKPRVVGTARSAQAERAADREAIILAAQTLALRDHNAAFPDQPPLTRDDLNRPARAPAPAQPTGPVMSIWRGYFSRGLRRGRWAFVKASAMIWLIYGIFVTLAAAFLIPPQELQIGQGVTDMNGEITDILGITAPGGDTGLGVAAMILVLGTLLAGVMQTSLVLQRARDAGARAWMTWLAIIASAVVPFVIIGFAAALLLVPHRRTHFNQADGSGGP